MVDDQLTYDVAEFVVCNRNEINHFLNEEAINLGYCENLFKDFPEMYDELLFKFKEHKLKEFLYETLELNPEEINLIVNKEFVKITLENY